MGTEHGARSKAGWQLVWGLFGSWFGAGRQLVWELVGSWFEARFEAWTSSGMELPLELVWLSSRTPLGRQNCVRGVRIEASGESCGELQMGTQRAATAGLGVP